MKCLQCQSTRLVRNARAVDHLDHLTKLGLRLEVDADPDAWLFKGTEAGTLTAHICADCGFVMFFMAKQDAEKLYEVQERRDRSAK